MVTILDSTIRHNIFETVYDLINTDKNSYNASSNPTLFGGLPDLETITFPAIVIMPIQVEDSNFLIADTNAYSLKNINIIIMFFTKSNKDLDYIADGIRNTLINANINGVILNNISDDNSELYPNEQQLKVKTLTITYNRR